MTEQPKELVLAPRADAAPMQSAEVVGPSSVLQMIERAASDPTIEIGKMERLLAMHERLAAQDAKAAFNEAMSSLQSKMTAIATDAENPSTRSKYTSYKSLDAALRPLYTNAGFSLTFDTGDGASENSVRVLCHVGHKAGHTHTYRADIPADGKGAKGGDVMTKTHAMGSAFTYGQRYLLKLIFNVAIGELDDDGNGAAQDSGPITREQKEELIALIKETNTDTAKFLVWAKSESVDDLPASKFKDAKEFLEKKKARK